MANVLVIDDEESIVFYVKQALGSVGHNVLATSRPAEGLRLAAENPVELAIVDLRMPGMSGLDFYGELVKIKKVPVLFITAFTSDQTLRQGQGMESLQQAFDSGFAAILYKPFSIKALVDRTQALLAKAGGG